LDPRAIWQSNTITGPKLPKGAQGAQDTNPTAIAEAAGVSRQVVYRVQDDSTKAEAMLAEWGM
jgi:hypothetical protein